MVQEGLTQEVWAAIRGYIDARIQTAADGLADSSASCFSALYRAQDAVGGPESSCPTRCDMTDPCGPVPRPPSSQTRRTRGPDRPTSS